MIHNLNPLSMKKNRFYVTLGLASCLFVATALSVCAQTTDTLQVTQVRTELLQMQKRLAKTKAEADSLQQALVQIQDLSSVAMGQEYWLDVIQNSKKEVQIFAAFIRDLVQDKLIKNEAALRSYHIDQEVFRVNVRKQDPGITQKYQQKYLSRRPNGDQTTSMTHSGGSFLGLKH